MFPDRKVEGGHEGKLSLEVPVSCDGMRLDRALALLLGDYSRETMKKLIGDGMVLVGGHVCKKNRHAVRKGELIKVSLPEACTADTEHLPAEVEFETIAEDDDFIVVNKRSGLVVHPARGNRTGTLLNGLLARYPDLAALPRAGIVHRLDKDTSGLMVVARNHRSMNLLSRQIKERSVRREYLAIVHGVPPGTGRINMPISRDRGNRLRMAVSQRGKEAMTFYRVKETFGGYSLVACRLHTGRTHQIRVHMEAIGYPILGDARYTRHVRGAEELPVIGRQALHAWKLSFIHPSKEGDVEWTCEMPDDMRTVVASLGKTHA